MYYLTTTVYTAYVYKHVCIVTVSVDFQGKKVFKMQKYHTAQKFDGEKLFDG